MVLASAAVLLFAVVLPFVLFFIAIRYVDEKNRMLVGQLGGPVIGALAALFAAFVAFSGLQNQFALQQKAFNQGQADLIEARIARLVELQMAAHRLRLRIDTDLQVPFVLGLLAPGTAAERETRHNEYKTVVDSVNAEMTALETAYVRALLRDETHKAMAGFISSVRDLEYTLTLAPRDLKMGANISPTSKPEVSAKFEQCQKAGIAAHQAFDVELGNLRARRNALTGSAD